MARHKEFNEDVTEEEVEDLTFSLHGETFTCYPEIGGAVVLRFAQQTQDPRTASGAVMELFEHCMPPEEYQRFDELLLSPTKITKMNTITSIAGYLIEEYTSRPTQQSSPSRSGTGKKNPS